MTADCEAAATAISCTMRFRAVWLSPCRRRVLMLVHTFIVRKPGAALEAEELIAFCKERIGSYKCPRGVSFIDAMPLSGAGKILKTVLRAPFWENHQRKVA